MNSDDFENQLKRQPLRLPPAEWRAEILEQARQVTHAAHAAEGAQPAEAAAREPNPLFSSGPWWREWLWPSPQAWAGLAAVWVIILGVQTLPRHQPAEMARVNSSAPARPTGTNSSLIAQRRELARLLEGSADAEPTPKPARPGPRSETDAPRKA